MSLVQDSAKPDCTEKEMPPLVLAQLGSACTAPQDVFESGNDILAIRHIDLDAKIENLGIE